jgi:Ca2+-binding EF-hand superfamily protein
MPPGLILKAALGFALGLAWPSITAAGSSELAQRSAREAYFSGFDRNADGRVQVEEYLAYMQRGFRQLDRNGNGVLDDHELPAGARRSSSRDHRGHERAVRQAFLRLDADGNGWLDLGELTAPPR